MAEQIPDVTKVRPSATPEAKRFLEVLATRRLLAIVRGADPDAALRTVITLAEEGVELIEVSLVTGDALRVIRDARAALGDAADLGAGTVVTADDARKAAEAGATFLVTPAVSEAVAEGGRLGLPVLAGALTPTEVVSRARHGGVGGQAVPRVARRSAPPARAAGPVPRGSVRSGRRSRHDRGRRLPACRCRRGRRGLAPRG